VLEEGATICEEDEGTLEELGTRMLEARLTTVVVRLGLLESPGEELVDRTNGVEMIPDIEGVEVLLVRREVLDDNLEELKSASEEQTSFEK
jgi:hypothetical protein